LFFLSHVLLLIVIVRNGILMSAIYIQRTGGEVNASKQGLKTIK
jgi:hypothetical protein